MTEIYITGPDWKHVTDHPLRYYYFIPSSTDNIVEVVAYVERLKSGAWSWYVGGLQPDRGIEPTRKMAQHAATMAYASKLARDILKHERNIH